MRRFKQDNSAQVLILASLAIALIISSTMVYIFQVSQTSYRDRSYPPETFVRIVKLSSRNLMIGTLANISRGGDNQTLVANLERWSSFVERQYYFGEGSLRFDLYAVSPYSSGLWMSWGDNGFGVTSTKSDFSMNVTSVDSELNVDYSVNVTTSLSISGKIKSLQNGYKVNVTIFLYNEGKFALAKSLTVYYKTYSSSWDKANLLADYRLEDFGNGTYKASFTEYNEPSTPPMISVEGYDLREIFVRANATCTEL